MPQARCIIGPEPTLSDPSWSPNGQALVWGEAGNLWTIDRADTCEGQPRQRARRRQRARLGAGAGQPGPRDVPPPEERRTPEQPQPRPTEDDRGRAPARQSKPAVTVPKSPAKLAAGGLKVSYRCTGALHRVGDRDGRPRRRPHAEICARDARLGSGARRLAKGGTATVVVRPSAKVRRRLARLRRVTTCACASPSRAAGAKAQSYDTRVVLRR